MMNQRLLSEPDLTPLKEDVQTANEGTPVTQGQDEAAQTSYNQPFNDTVVSMIHPYDSNEQIKTRDSQNVPMPPTDVSSIYPDSNATPNFLSMLDTKIGQGNEIIDTSLGDHQSFVQLTDVFGNDRKGLDLQLNEPKLDEPDFGSFVQLEKPRTKIRVNLRTKQKSTFDLNRDIVDQPSYEPIVNRSPLFQQLQQ